VGSDSLQDVVAKIRATYGKIMAAGNRGRSFKLRRFSTGILDLDLVLGETRDGDRVEFGAPWGRFFLAYGPPMGGKSVLLYKHLAGAQQYCRYCRDPFLVDDQGIVTCDCPDECPECGAQYTKLPYDGPEPTDDDPFDWRVIHDLWTCSCLEQTPGTKAKKDRRPKQIRRAGRIRAAILDAEQAFDDGWPVLLGVDLDTVYVIRPGYAEQGIDVANALLQSGEIDFLGVDSVAELVPSAEISLSTEENGAMGLQARLVNRALRLWSATINDLGTDTEHLPFVFLVNQMRENMKGFTLPPGGWMQRFKSSVIFRVHPIKSKRKTVKSGEKEWEEIEYMEIGGYLEKSKVGIPLAEFTFRLYLDEKGEHAPGSTDEEGTVLDRALEMNVIARDGNKYSFGEKVWTTQVSIREAFRASPRLFRDVRCRTLLACIGEDTTPQILQDPPDATESS
jgi:RecA/RadA recombinase